MSEKTIEQRGPELVKALAEVLEEGEVAFVLTRDGKGVFALPDEVEAKARVGELSLTETFNIVSQAAQFMGLGLLHLKTNISKETGEEPSRIVTPGAPRIVKAH